ncbi:MAG: redox-regulated ATPase YchF [Patescibacteria group bacterium]
MKIGIVGLPNVGKSTLFQALTKREVDTSNYPFATIEPNVGIVPVPDKRLAKLAEISSSEKIIPAIVEFVDIAGLVKGANQGEGLGNQFLRHIREADAILEVVRTFEKSDVSHVEGAVNPQRDMEIIATELILKDLETINSHLPKIEKELKGTAKETAKKISRRLELFESLKNSLSQGQLANQRPEEEKEAAQSVNLLTVKPFMYIYNGEPQKTKIEKMPENSLILNIKEESDLNILSEEEQREFRTETSLDLIIKKAYEMLGLISFFTTGEKETRAWTIKKGSTAKQAGAAIHTDFEEKFIKANVIFWEDLIKAGGWSQARNQGLLRLEGKDYLVQDGDVMEFKI